MPIGRPRKWDDANAFQAAVDRYFKRCDETIIIKQVVQKGQIVEVPTPTPYTMAGLARDLDIDRTTLNRYEHWDERPDFCNIIAQARNRIHEQNVVLGLIGAHDSRISALNLASNYGYSQKTQVDISDDRLVQAILDALPAEIREGVCEAIRLKLEALKPIKKLPEPK